MKNLLLSAICIVSLFLSSCQNWIDVNPKTDIEGRRVLYFRGRVQECVDRVI